MPRRSLMERHCPLSTSMIEHAAAATPVHAQAAHTCCQVREGGGNRVANAHLAWLRLPYPSSLLLPTPMVEGDHVAPAPIDRSVLSGVRPLHVPTHPTPGPNLSTRALSALALPNQTHTPISSQHHSRESSQTPDPDTRAQSVSKRSGTANPRPNPVSTGNPPQRSALTGVLGRDRTRTTCPRTDARIRP